MKTVKRTIKGITLTKKTFLTSFLFVFIFSLLQQSGFTQRILLFSPLPKTRDIFTTDVLPRLQQIPKDSFSLSSKPSFIQSAQASEPYDSVSAYVAIDFTNGNILAEKNKDIRLPIASLTKIMSAVVALDLADPSESFRVSQTASDIIPTKIGVIPGEELTLKELLEAALMTSANDAVQVMKEGIDNKYHAPVFVNAMNAKARMLGLTNSHFNNPQGFDGNNYSSASDLAILTHYALSHYPVISDIIQKDYLYLPENSTHKQFDLNNWNGLLDVYPDVKGVKIGNTDAAGTTTIVLSTRENHPILVVLLGAPGIIQRDMWTATILDNVYADAFGLPPVQIDESMLRAKYASWYTHS